jgi:hypothetical protein
VAGIEIAHPVVDGLGYGSRRSVPAPLALVCEIAFNAGPADDITAVTWTDVTSWLRLTDGISLTRGRQDETQQVGAGVASFTLSNPDGRFTPENSSGFYYPHVQIRRPVRFSVDWGTSLERVWTGYVDSWLAGWNSGVQPVVRVVASDLMARLANHTFRPLTTEEQSYDAPVLLYTLADDAGSTTATNRSGSTYASLPVTQAGTGGTIVFGQIGALGADVSEPVAVFTRVDGSNGKYLTQTFNPLPQLAAVSGVTLSGYVYLPLAVAGVVRVMELGRIASTDILAIDLSANVPVVTLKIGATTVTGTSTGGAINDGAWHHVAAVYDGANVILYVDGVARLTSAAVLGAATFSILTVGATNAGATLFNGWLSGIAVYGSALSVYRIPQHAAVRNGAVGEDSLTRFNRTVRLAVGSWTENVSLATPAATMGVQPFTDQDASAILYGIADAEVAPVCILSTGQVRWQARTERTASPTPTQIPAYLVSSDTGFSTSDQLMANDVTYSRPGGATVTVTDAGSIASYGHMKVSKSLYYDTDAQLTGAANYTLSAHSQPHIRTGSLTIDLVTADPTIPSSTLLGLDIGAIVRVTGLPMGSVTFVDVFIEGVNDSINANGWRRTYNTSPFQAGGSVWLLGSTTYSLLGTTTRLGF